MKLRPLSPMQDPRTSVRLTNRERVESPRPLLVALAFALAPLGCQSSSSSRDAAAPAEEAAQPAPAASSAGAEGPESTASPGKKTTSDGASLERSDDDEGSEAATERPESEAKLEAEKERAPSEALQRGDRPALPARLTAEEHAFSAALEPSELSCSGARPHRDAICQLADRLCNESDPATVNADKSCRAARELCDDVRARYREACDD